jgi:hypothetical protein
VVVVDKVVHRAKVVVRVVVRVVLKEEDLLVTRGGCVKGEIEGLPGVVVVVDRLLDKEMGVGHHKGEGHRVVVIHEGHHLARDEELHRVVVEETLEAHHQTVVDVGREDRVVVVVVEGEREERRRVVGETREAHHRMVVGVEIGGHHPATESVSLEFQWLRGRTTGVGLTVVAVGHQSDGRRAAMEWENRQGIQINCPEQQTPKK